MARTFIIIMIICSHITYADSKIEGSSFSGNFDLGLNFISNIENTLQFNNIFLIKYKYKKSIFKASNNVTFINKSGEDELLNKGNQELKYTFSNKNLETNIIFDHSYDNSRMLKNRFTSGIGLTYNIIFKKNKQIGLGLSVIREKEVPIIGENFLKNRVTSDLNYMQKINQHITLKANNSYKPNINKVGDFRWKTNIALRINLSQKLLLSINTTYNYESFPPENMPEYDYQLTNSISYTF